MSIYELKNLCEKLIAEGKGDYECLSNDTAYEIDVTIDDKKKEIWVQ